MPREDLLILMNACQYHLCPSEYEGFGHYINEARSTGALIISTDAAPMNELVKNGILIKPDRFYKHHSGTMAKIDNIDKIIEATEKVKLLSEKESTKTRQDYQQKKNFINNNKTLQITVKLITLSSEIRRSNITNENNKYCIKTI